MNSCKTIIVYPDGYYTSKEINGLEPLARITICKKSYIEINNRLKIDISSCASEVGKLIRENSNEYIDFCELGEHLKELLNVCGNLDRLMLVLSLFAARSRVDHSKILIDYLLEEADK